MSRLPAYQPLTRPEQGRIDRRASAIAKLLALGALSLHDIVQICGPWDRDTTHCAMEQLFAQRALVWCYTASDSGNRFYKLAQTQAQARAKVAA